MKTTFGLAVAALVVVGSAATAQDPKAAQDDAKAALESMIARPTKAHDLLKRDAGTWDATVKAWMGGPDAPPVESKGVETNRVIGGGLWLVGEFRGEFAGLPFEGRTQQGYDAKKGKYVGTWIDSMTDKVGILEGAYDDKSETLTLFMDCECPKTGKPVKERHTLKYVGDDTRILTMSTPDEGGAEVKMMEITYKKRKP